MNNALVTQSAPYSQEAEEAVLGAVLVNPESFLTVASFLKAEDFFFVRHGYVWQAMLRLNERNEPIDYLTLLQELKDLGWLEEIGGPAYITYLVNNTPTSIYAEVYGRLVERAAVRRRLMLAADEIKALALNEELTIENVTVEAETKLFSVTDRQLKREFIPMRDAIHEYFDRIEHLMHHHQDSLGLPSGFRDLDSLLGGLQKSDLIIFAGRPGVGKTAFMLSLAMNAARIGGRIGIFTMEMGVDQITQRLVSMETGINTQKLRLGHLTPQEYSRFVEAAGRISTLRIFIDDTPALSPIQMRTKCRRLMHEHGIDLIILDYLQLMNSGTAYENNRVQEVSYISRSLKELARELNIPILSAAQLSRAVEQRQDKRPVLSDLRESGCLAGESLVYLPDEGRYVPIRDLSGKTGFRVMSLNTDTWKLEPAVVTNAFCTGTKPVYKLTTRLGRTIRATANHKFLTICGWKRLDELTYNDSVASLEAIQRRRLKPYGYEKPNALKALKIASFVGTRYISSLQQQPDVLTFGDPTFIYDMPDSRDVYWDSIVSIEPDGETEVFDLTVPGNSNFASCNIICHNSLEQDSDVVMFLYRDVLYNEATEFPNQADVIIAKHRNGPTGTISLYFDKSITKFTDAATRRVDLEE
jgi:replicative DNA helicase